MDENIKKIEESMIIEDSELLSEMCNHDFDIVNCKKMMIKISKGLLFLNSFELRMRDDFKTVYDSLFDTYYDCFKYIRKFINESENAFECTTLKLLMILLNYTKENLRYSDYFDCL